MKTTRQLAAILTAWSVIVLALATGCADNGPPPPPPGVAVVGFVPDYCFWDGFEYVGWDGFDYYYWAPSRVWCICDPIRVRRATVWVDAHPNWHPQPKPTVQNQTQPPPAITARPKPHSSPAMSGSSAPHITPVRRGKDHDDRDDHGHGP